IKLPRKTVLDAVRNVAVPSILLPSGAEKVKLKSLNKCGTACSTPYRAAIKCAHPFNEGGPRHVRRLPRAIASSGGKRPGRKPQVVSRIGSFLSYTCQMQRWSPKSIV